MPYIIILHVSGFLSGSWSLSVFCYSENCPWQGHYVLKAPSCLACLCSLSHASWQASHLLTTVCNAYLLFSHCPRDFHFTSSHSYERSTSETSLGRPLYVYQSITIRSIIPYHPHHLNIAVELTFLRTVDVSTINTK